ncbi:polysaccharide deacetylase family protein [Piscinibacter sp. HJYY11]|uniref:polysaccharide deacetylase family protein n=1 Tax=Piscinibacter sp. HJYY11 TaxID=2801333 RepID=UPI00191C9ABE|nr:polysaccharide deacetylase family protein [Piscinibacter sp. HJYY11]MBL0728433.1 polysaccharide deacetylase family protein [Piscinibacter sp. HJYY11]
MQSSSQLTRPTSSLRWHEPVLVKATVACHIGAVAALLLELALWPWVAGAVVLNHLLLALGGLWPRSTWLGANVRRLPDAAVARREVAVTIDDGPDPQVTPRVLDLLDAHGAKATFFCIAEQAARHPQLVREIIARGHSVQNHSHRHSHTFSLLGPQAFAREIRQSQEALAQLTGRRPAYFRAPAGLRNLFLAPVLAEHGLQLVSWTRRGFDTARRDPAGVLRRLTRGLAAGDILLLHDRGSAVAASGRPVVLEVLPPLLQTLQHMNLKAVTLPHAMETPA